MFMIDTLNLNLGLSEAGDIDLLSEVPFRFDDEPQEHYYPDGTGGKYPVLCGHLGSLNVKVSRMGVAIKDSSFCKWVLGSNFKTLTRGDIQQGIEKLSDSLHLPFERASVTRLDVGQNIVTKAPTDVYLRHLGVLKYTKRLPQPNGLYYTGTNYQLAFYDKVREQRRAGEKVPELYQGRNVLRYELRFIHRLTNLLNVPEITGGLLYDEGFYISLFQQWRGYYRSIQKIGDIELNFENMTTKRDLYKAGLLALVEQQGGQLEVIAQINEALKSGKLKSRKQAHDLREAVNEACKVNGGLVKPNDMVKELDRKIDEATRYFR